MSKRHSQLKSSDLRGLLIDSISALGPSASPQEVSKAVKNIYAIDVSPEQILSLLMAIGWNYTPQSLRTDTTEQIIQERFQFAQNVRLSYSQVVWVSERLVDIHSKSQNEWSHRDLKLECHFTLNKDARIVSVFNKQIVLGCLVAPAWAQKLAFSDSLFLFAPKHVFPKQILCTNYRNFDTKGTTLLGYQIVSVPSDSQLLNPFRAIEDRVIRDWYALKADRTFQAFKESVQKRIMAVSGSQLDDGFEQAELMLSLAHRKSNFPGTVFDF